MVRLAEENDFYFLKHTWKVCFDDPDSFIDWNFERNFSFSNTIVADFKNTPASNMQLMPHKIKLRNLEYDVNYVSGVATLPECRNKGLVRELFSYAFPLMKKRCQPISLLVPFNYQFYEKFGYKQCYEKVFRYAEILPDNDYITEDNFSGNIINTLDLIYRNEMKSKTGYAIRTREDWQRILEDLLIISKGKIYLSPDKTGYALITSRNEGGYEIHEMLGGCDIPHTQEKKPFAMARIIDAKRVLSDLAKDFKGELCIKIVDDNIMENNKILKVSNADVTETNAFDFEMDIMTLCQLIFGFIDDFTDSGLFGKAETYLNMIF
ncbi:MAG: GNAT family N-acetyltransferase [Clostridia bacterium]|nr:GNAT family N-acetyltransferase [Clostridia bacterium]